jgi:hypothetical protein
MSDIILYNIVYGISELYLTLCSIALCCILNQGIEMESSGNFLKYRVNSISFNHNQTIMHLALSYGFKIFDIDPLALKIDKSIDHGILIV